MPRLGEVNEAGYIRRKALAALIGYSLADLVYISASEKLRNFIAKTGGTEIPAAKSLYDILEGTSGVMKVYPSMANGVTVTSADTAWTAGTWTQVVPVNTITSRFALLGVSLLEEYAATLQSELDIGTGAAASEVVVGTIPLVKVQRTDVGYLQIAAVPLIRPPVVAANTRVAARFATNANAAINATVKLVYIALPL